MHLLHGLANDPFEEDLRDAAQLLDGVDGVLTLADLFHMSIEETSVAESLRTHCPQIGHVHFADSNRKPAGDGHTDMAAVGEALKAGGYEAWVSAEAFPWPDPEAAARKTVESFRRWFA